jgi:hypothetical protein
MFSIFYLFESFFDEFRFCFICNNAGGDYKSPPTPSFIKEGIFVVLGEVI